MASTPSTDELLAKIATLEEENKTLFHKWSADLSLLTDMESIIEELRNKIRTLLTRVPSSALSAPVPYGAAAAVSASSEPTSAPSVARSTTSYGVVPSLGPSPSVGGVDLTDCFRGLTFRDSEGNLMVGLMPTVSYDDGMHYVAVTDGWVKYVKREPHDEDDE